MTTSTCGDGLLSLERKSVQPFATQDEYLYAMKEDLADWFNTLYSLRLAAVDFCEHLDSGVLLCQHANYVQTFLPLPAAAGPGGIAGAPTAEVVFRAGALPGSFPARDNVANFITWCRHRLGIADVLLFETNDLVERHSERNVVLCLLEVARRGAKYGVLAPVLVQLEAEIDAELAGRQPPAPPAPPPPTCRPQPARRHVDMMSLDEMVSGPAHSGHVVQLRGRAPTTAARTRSLTPAGALLGMMAEKDHSCTRPKSRAARMPRKSPGCEARM